jgi:hypothetical protein
VSADKQCQSDQDIGAGPPPREDCDAPGLRVLRGADRRKSRRALPLRLAGFDKQTEKRRGLLVTIDRASLEIADSTYSWDVKVILDETTGGVVAFSTAYGSLPARPVREPSDQDLSESLSSSGVYAPAESTTKTVFSELIKQAWGCGVPVSRAAGIAGRFMERQRDQISLRMPSGGPGGQRSLAGPQRPVVEPVWIISGVDCPESTVETPGRRHVHAVFIDSDRIRCLSCDTY